MSAFYTQAHQGIHRDISPNQNQQYAFNNLELPSAGVTATSKEGSSILNIHNMVPGQHNHYLDSNQVTEWAPILHPIGGQTKLIDSLKNSVTLKNTDMIG